MLRDAGRVEPDAAGLAVPFLLLSPDRNCHFDCIPTHRDETAMNGTRGRAAFFPLFVSLLEFPK